MQLKKALLRTGVALGGRQGVVRRERMSCFCNISFHKRDGWTSSIYGKMSPQINLIGSKLFSVTISMFDSFFQLKRKKKSNFKKTELTSPLEHSLVWGRFFN